jgi:hypothetical protein
MRYQHWGAGACAPGSTVDDGSELLGLPYKLSKCSADSYMPGSYQKKPVCNVPGKSTPRSCMTPTEDTRLSNPPCTLKSTGWNRWEWLCFNPQDKALIPFEWNVNSSIVMKDNHVPCMEQPLEQSGFLPNANANDAHRSSVEGFTTACGGAAAPGYPFNAGFSSCANIEAL